MFTLRSVSDVVHLGLTKKDNYIMWVSATGSRINIFMEKMAGQVIALHWRGHLNIIITVYCGNARVIILWYKDPLSNRYSVFAYLGSTSYSRVLAQNSSYVLYAGNAICS